MCFNSKAKTNARRDLSGTHSKKEGHAVLLPAIHCSTKLRKVGEHCLLRAFTRNLRPKCGSIWQRHTQNILYTERCSHIICRGMIRRMNSSSRQVSYRCPKRIGLTCGGLSKKRLARPVRLGFCCLRIPNTRSAPSTAVLVRQQQA